LMGKRIGFPLNDIREMLNLYQPASGNKAQISLALKKGEKQLRVLMRQKRTIEEAIDELNRAMDSLRSAA
ncbi:MAG TPA: MerR family DNA-binding protein, partial [Rhizobiaceae bacterium]|nr:MerR family DNA-binding protein [Rhizobiaceae bacterium]